RDDALPGAAPLRGDRSAGDLQLEEGGGGDQRRRRDRRRGARPPGAEPSPRPLVAAGASGRRLPGERPHGGQSGSDRGLGPATDPALGALGAAAAAAAGDALGLARDSLLATRWPGADRTEALPAVDRYSPFHCWK